MMMMMMIIIIIIIIGIVNWHQEELQKLDRKTRKLLTIHEQHHPKADVDSEMQIACMFSENREEVADAVGSSPCSRNYKTGGVCRQGGRPTNTGRQNTPTQHPLCSVTDSQMPQDRSIERNKKNEGQLGGENKRKMAREEDAWTIAT